MAKSATGYGRTKPQRGSRPKWPARALRIGFNSLKMHRIILRIAVGNRASERVAEKLGFVREGLLREEINVRGNWLDHSVWGMLEHEFHRFHDAEQSTSR